MKNKTKTNFNKNKDKSNMSNSKIDNKKEKSNMKSNYNWQIHAIKNGCKCENDGDYIFDMIPGAANFHTHGLEQYDHPDFQLVLDYELGTAADILNALGERVRNGEKFKTGDYVKGIFEDCDVRLDVFEESGRDVLRVIVPDSNNIFPDEDGCNPSYYHQLYPTDDLYINHDLDKKVRTDTVFELSNGFRIEIVRNGDTSECYLSHKRYGLKSLLFGISEPGIIDVDAILENISDDIESYQKEYFYPEDIIDPTKGNEVVERFQQDVSFYEVEDGFMIDTINHDSMCESYLYHKTSGIKVIYFTFDLKEVIDIKKQFETMEERMAIYVENFMDAPKIVNYADAELSDR